MVAAVVHNEGAPGVNDYEAWAFPLCYRWHALGCSETRCSAELSRSVFLTGLWFSCRVRGTVNAEKCTLSTGPATIAANTNDGRVGKKVQYCCRNPCIGQSASLAY